MKRFLERLYSRAVELNHENLLNSAEKDTNAKMLDVGCDDGSVTMKVAKKIGAKSIYGVEIVDESAKQSAAKGIIVKKFDLNEKFAFDDEFFDVVLANQVIEHLIDSDSFLSEVHRILKRGGYAIISTENASSWSNIFAGVMGWQIFSLTNFSSIRHGIGNPLSLHNDVPNLSSWNHVRIYNYRGLKEYFAAYNFLVDKIRGAGYFPLPSRLGDIDKIHCHFMTFKIRKSK